MKKKASKSTEEPKEETKVRASIRICKDVIQRARAAAYWTPGTTLSSLIEDALVREIARLEKKRGEPFPEGDVKLNPGRPVKPQ